MKSYRVAKNIPVPEPRGRRKLYEFPELEIGESFLVTSKSEVYAARKRMKSKGQEIVSRRMGDDSWRIWRAN
jgi:ABC-type sulfate transport system substrate-binding protein